MGPSKIELSVIFWLSLFLQIGFMRIFVRAKQFILAIARNFVPAKLNDTTVLQLSIIVVGYWGCVRSAALIS
jgi:hypothetical protein